jgi:hypothetical protein
LVDGEEPLPSNDRGCRQAKEDVRKRKFQKAPKMTTVRVLFSSHTAPGLSFTMVLYSSSLSHPQLQWPAPRSLEAQPVEAPNTNSSSLNDMFKVVATVLQQIMTELDGVE